MNALDYAVVAAYLLAITAFGSYFARFQKNTRNYFLTDNSTPWWAICFTVVATETSTLTFIGVPASAYAGNWTFLQLAAGYVLGRIIVSVLFLPRYFRGALVTSYQLLQQRFGPSVSTVSAGLFLVTRSLADGIRLFATALVISIVTGVPVPWTVIVLGTAMIVYTVRGGSAAVIWTDVVQMFVYVAGALVVGVALVQAIPGGFAEVVRLGSAAGKFTVLDPSFDPTKVYTLWAGLAGGIALTLATHGTDQFLVQRLLSADSPRGAARGLVLSGFIVFAQFTMFLLIGAMLYAYHQHFPLTAALPRNDAILPRFIVDQLPHGVIGFIIAAIVAAALSPSINAMAATTINDFYLRYTRTPPDEARLLSLSKRFTIMWGLVQLGVALAAQWLDQSVLDAGLGVLSLTTGPVLGAFLIGVLTRRVGAAAMIAGMAAGGSVLVILWWNALVGWTWYALIGSAVTAATALMIGLAAPRADATPAGAGQKL
ncbi:MAG TPA: sodium:solute symporter [Vicinamibacterales bacterium]|nr:sodium:solute symporter [Vicinamibacterales bacterium]